MRRPWPWRRRGSQFCSFHFGLSPSLTEHCRNRKHPDQPASILWYLKLATSEAVAVATAASRRWIMYCSPRVWLGVALAATLLGCDALAPVAAPPAPVQDAIARGH